MNWISTLTFIMCAGFSYVISKKKITPFFVFSLVWGVIMFCECLHLFGLNQSHSLTYCVIFLGVLSFGIGSMICRRVVFKHACHSFYLDKRLFIILSILTISFMMYPALTNVVAMSNGLTDFIEIRKEFSNIYSNIVLALIYNYIVQPFAMACLPIFSAIVFCDRYQKREKVLFFIFVTIIIFEKILIDAGRGIIIYFLIMMFFSYQMFVKKGQGIQLKRRMKKLLVCMGTVAILAYVGITIARGGSFSFLPRQIYVYICGCVPFLDSCIESVKESGQYLYGTGGLHGVIQLVFTMLDNVGLVSYPDFVIKSDELYNATLIARNIGENLYFNAYASAFYNFYIDGGIVAVVIEMLIYGGASRCIYNHVCREEENYRIKAIYFFVLYSLFFSFIRFQFSLAKNVIVCVLIFLIIRKRNINESCSN